MQIRVLTALVVGAGLFADSTIAAFKLPKGVVLPEGVVIPDDFELPKGLVIPEGFIVTQDMVDQFIKYMENKKKNPEAADSQEDDDLWFKQLAKNHPNANLQMNVQRIETAAANEESEFTEKLEDTLLSKEVILPTIGVIILIISVWAFITKCGKRSCCRKAASTESEVKARRTVVGTSSKSSETDSNNDLENGTQFSHAITSERSSNIVTSSQGKQSKVGAPKADLEMVNTINMQGRSSAPSKSAAILSANDNRNSSVFGKATSTANRFSLPVVSVPIDHIKSAASDAASVSNPSSRT